MLHLSIFLYLVQKIYDIVTHNTFIRIKSNGLTPDYDGVLGNKNWLVVETSYVQFICIYTTCLFYVEVILTSMLVLAGCINKSAYFLVFRCWCFVVLLPGTKLSPNSNLLWYSLEKKVIFVEILATSDSSLLPIFFLDKSSLLLKCFTYSGIYSKALSVYVCLAHSFFLWVFRA